MPNNVMILYRLHIFLVLTSYVLSIFLPNAAVCCLMLPLAKCILQTLESMNIGRQEEERELVEDEYEINFFLYTNH